MLSRIEIRNFAIIQSLALDWSEGMTVITGETGAGKSIVIDALGLTLGERAEQTVIYPNAKQAEVTAIFDLEPTSAALNWLSQQDLDEEAECILRRVVIRDGKNKCFINGRSVTQSQMKELGSFLVDIHGQHSHQSLLKSKEQLNLLDRYAAHNDLLNEVKQSSAAIKKIQLRRAKLLDEKQTRQARYELLAYQVEELSLANPQQSILNELEENYKQAATSQDRLLLAQNAAMLLNGDEEQTCLSSLASIIDKVSQLNSLDKQVTNLLETFIQAENLLQDANSEIRHYLESLECDPENLQLLDEQLALFHDLARKHHISLPQLPTHFQSLQEELSQLDSDESELQQIEISHRQAVKDYQTKAAKLTLSRQKTATQLEKLITEKIQGLAMQGGQLKISLLPIENQYTSNGAENIEFLVSANPGQPLQVLSKVASGGELSRISLAIAVITAEQQLVPSIIFDEVDVGIGGGTAETVGKLLNQLAQKRQVICVTHQPQVASCGDQHLIASKTKQIDSTTTRIESLTPERRIEEIARMLGGLTISETTISHAKEMLGG